MGWVEIMNHHFSGSSFLFFSSMKQILQKIRPKYLALIYRAKQEVQFAFCMYIVRFYIPDFVMCMYSMECHLWNYLVGNVVCAKWKLHLWLNLYFCEMKITFLVENIVCTKWNLRLWLKLQFQQKKYSNFFGWKLCFNKLMNNWFFSLK